MPYNLCVSAQGDTGGHRAVDAGGGKPPAKHGIDRAMPYNLCVSAQGDTGGHRAVDAGAESRPRNAASTERCPPTCAFPHRLTLEGIAPSMRGRKAARETR